MIRLSRSGLLSVWQQGQTASMKVPPKNHLLVVLHGRGDSAQGFDWLLPALGLPYLSALLLNAPDPYHSGYSWYDLPPNQLTGVLRSRKALGTAFEEIEENGYPPERCFLLGFSQGCLVTLEFGARYHRRLRGCIGVSGYCYDEKAIIAEASPITKQADWLVTHGEFDTVLPVSRTRAQIQALKLGGFKIDYREYPKRHEIDPQKELPDLRDWIWLRMLEELQPYVG